MQKGTKRYTANELAAAKDGIGMEARMAAGVESSSYTYRILTTYLEESLEVASEVLQNPTYPENELIKFQQQVLAYLSNIETNPSLNATDFFRRAIYGSTHPLGGLWNPELVNNLNRESIQEFHAREIAPDNITVFMIGDIDIDTAKAMLKNTFASWKDLNRSKMRPIGTVVTEGPRVILINQPDAPQSTIRVGHALEPFNADGDTELGVVNGIFGADFESRINMNLREDKAWSYGIGSRISKNASGNQYLVVAGSVQTDKTMESLKELMREYTEYVTTRPATDAELQRVKLNRVRSLPGKFASKRGFLSSMISSDSFGLPFNYAENTAKRVEAVSLEDVNNRAERVIRPDKLTWIVVGDLDEIGEKVRSLGYGPVEVWDGFGERIH